MPTWKKNRYNNKIRSFYDLENNTYFYAFNNSKDNQLLFNDESEYCILPKTYRALDTNNDGKISPEEIEKAYKLLKKAGKIK